MYLLGYFNNGFLFGFGLVIGVVCAILLTIFLASALRTKKRFDQKKLLKAFQKYLEKLEEEGRFEEMGEVTQIVNNVRDGLMPTNLIEKYEIKRKKDLIVRDNIEGGSAMRMVEKYRVIGRKGKS